MLSVMNKLLKQSQKVMPEFDEMVPIFGKDRVVVERNGPDFMDFNYGVSAPLLIR